jgi:DNA repair ATPase RecN
MAITDIQPWTAKADRYHQGLTVLHQARHNHFADKQLLGQAFEHFKGAIRLNRQDIRPYLGTVYLLFLMGETQLAQYFLKQAQRLEPDHADIAALENYLAQPAYETQQIPLDFDQLYQDVRSFIFAQTRWQMSLGTPQTPQTDTDEIHLLKQFTHFQTQLDAIRQYLLLMDEELDVADLWQNLKPLETLEKRYQRLAEHIQATRAIATALETYKAQSEQWLTSVPQLETKAQVKQLENQLEQMMDHCDRIADQLEALQKQKIPTTALEQRYEQWVQLLERLDDLLDETESTLT